MKKANKKSQSILHSWRKNSSKRCLLRSWCRSMQLTFHRPLQIRVKLMNRRMSILLPMKNPSCLNSDSISKAKSRRNQKLQTKIKLILKFQRRIKFRVCPHRTNWRSPPFQKWARQRRVLSGIKSHHPQLNLMTPRMPSTASSADCCTFPHL